MPGDSALLKSFVKNLASNYANHCDRVFVPSESIAAVLHKRGVTVPVSVVPTGVELARFETGSGIEFRHKLAIPQDAFVVGHLGRLSDEKNLPFLLESIIRFIYSCKIDRTVHCLIAGLGPLEKRVKSEFSNAGISSQLHMAGVMGEEALSDAYHAMNVFAFASTTETQGMVLTEAMASGIPVVAVDAPGVREVLDDPTNGRLIPEASVDLFVTALQSVASADPVEYGQLCRGALRTAERFSMVITAEKALELYSRLHNYNAVHRHPNYSRWTNTLHTFESEWDLVKNTVHSAVDAVEHPSH